MPLALGAAVVGYQLGLARLIHDNMSEAAHFAVEILLFATVGPLVLYLALSRVGVWLDERQQLEAQIRSKEERLAALMETSADAILVLNSDLQIESWNRGAALIFGYESYEILGSSFTRLLYGMEAPAVELDWLKGTVQRTGYVRAYETRCRTRSGSIVDVELTATSISDVQSDAGLMSMIMRDVTDRKRREQEIARLNASLNQQVRDRTQELAEKVDQLALANAELESLDLVRSDFVSIVSHQIRAPLTNMQGAVERLRTDHPDLSGAGSQMLSIIEQQIARLDGLVKDVLNAATIEAGELAIHAEPTSVAPLIRQVVSQIRARSPDRKFEIREKPGLPAVMADRDRLAEVLANLVDNADKYSGPGGTIRIEIRADQSDVTVSVLDAGRGLPDVDPERLFDKYFRAERGDAQSAYGHGLGLYVCRQLIEAQGGRIWAENRRVGGSSFSFALPVWTGAHG